MVESEVVESPAARPSTQPIGVLAALIAGFECIAARPILIIPSLLLDLFLWLGPHLRVTTLFEGMAAILVPPYRVDPALGDQLALLRTSVVDLGERFNLFSALSRLPFGIPSLMTGRMPLSAPFGEVVFLDLERPFDVLLLWLGLMAVGIVSATYYQRSLARQVAPKADLISGWLAAIRMLVFLLLAGIGLLLLGVVIIIITSVATVILPLVGAGVLFLGFSLFFWVTVYLAFTPHGIVRYGFGVLKAMTESFTVVRWNLLSTVGYLVLAFSIYWVGNLVWFLPDSSSWFTVLAIIGHAFVGAMLFTGSFAFYQGRWNWLAALREAIEAQASDIQRPPGPTA